MVSAQGTSQWLAAGVGLAVGALLLLLGLIVYIVSRRRHETPEERQLRIAITELRTRLCITAADGFLLSSERSRGFSAVCQHSRQPVVIQRSFVEAAARLSLLQDFDIHQFDAFCIFLRCSRNDDGNAENSAPPEYHALCNWLLDICRTLIRPAFAGLGEAGVDSSLVDSDCSLPNDERFPYFVNRVCKSRVWSDMGGWLFQRLRHVAQACARPRE